MLCAYRSQVHSPTMYTVCNNPRSSTALRNTRHHGLSKLAMMRTSITAVTMMTATAVITVHNSAGALLIRANSTCRTSTTKHRLSNLAGHMSNPSWYSKLVAAAAAIHPSHHSTRSYAAIDARRRSPAHSSICSGPLPWL